MQKCSLFSTQLSIKRCRIATAAADMSGNRADGESHRTMLYWYCQPLQPPSPPPTGTPHHCPVIKWNASPNGLPALPSRLLNDNHVAMQTHVLCHVLYIKQPTVGCKPESPHHDTQLCPVIAWGRSSLGGRHRMKAVPGLLTSHPLSLASNCVNKYAYSLFIAHGNIILSQV